MKKEEIIMAIGLANDKYVLEAQSPSSIKKKRRIIIGTLAACISLILVNLWLFMPFPTPASPIAVYADSQYYPIIERLYLNIEAANKLPYSNNFEKMLYNINKPKKNTSASTDHVLNADKDHAQTYKEITDNQNDGVIESDRIKRSDKYVYYVQKNKLMIYAVGNGEYELVGSTFLPSTDTDIFLSLDCKYVTAISRQYNSNSGHKTHVCVLDVSSPDAIKTVSEITLDSQFLEARYSQDHLIISSRFNINLSQKDYSKINSFIPKIRYDQKNEYIPIDNVRITDYKHSEYSAYTLLYLLDPITLAPKSSFGLFGGSESVYFSKDNVFLVANYEKDGVDTCEISCVSYTEGKLEFKCAIEAEGNVMNRRWMDEHNGVLRVFSDTEENGKKSATLSVFDLKTKKTIAKIKNFAPNGESIKSVRFADNTAYVCTAFVEEIVIIDPVFFFDISDHHNITYTDTGTIPGFSMSLIDYKNGDLLGVGTDENQIPKLELYQEENETVVSKSKVKCGAAIPNEYKSYLIDRERGLFGMEVMLLSENNYKLFEIKDGEIREIFSVKTHEDNFINRTRAIVTDGYLYIFSDFGISAHKIETS